MSEPVPAGEFRAFPEPRRNEDEPVVTSVGLSYRCTGCGAKGLPGGMWIYSTVRGGLVVGLRMTTGEGGYEVHRCGDVD